MDDGTIRRFMGVDKKGDKGNIKDDDAANENWKQEEWCLDNPGDDDIGGAAISHVKKALVDSLWQWSGRKIAAINFIA